jgi:hypothetical protein
MVVGGDGNLHRDAAVTDGIEQGHERQGAAGPPRSVVRDLGVLRGVCGGRRKE